MPTEYIIENLLAIRNSVLTLTENNILISDMRQGNTIISSSAITIIDTDSYKFNTKYKKDELRYKNLLFLKQLFVNILLNSLFEYHDEYKSYRAHELINYLYSIHSEQGLEQTIKRLTKYKYPIDYLMANRY